MTKIIMALPATHLTTYQEGAHSRPARIDKWGNLEAVNLSPGTSAVDAVNCLRINGNTTNTATASATDTIALGCNTTASGADSLVIGGQGSSTGARNILLGVDINPAVSGDDCTVIGTQNFCTVGGLNGLNVVVGNNAGVNNADACTVVGQAAIASADNATVVGNGAFGQVAGATALGTDADVTGAAIRGIGIGHIARVTGLDGIALGANASAAAADAIAIGSSDAVATNTRANGAGAISIGAGQQNAVPDSCIIGRDGTNWLRLEVANEQKQDPNNDTDVNPFNPPTAQGRVEMATTVASGGTHSFRIFNSRCLATSTVIVTAESSTAANIPLMVGISNVSAGGFDVLVRNTDGTNATSNPPVIHFCIFGSA